MQSAHRGSATHRQARRFEKRQGWRQWIGFGIAAFALAFASVQTVLAADGSKVVAQLQGVNGAITKLANSILGQGDGNFSTVENASAIPFLGGSPGSLVSDLFGSALDDLADLDDITAANEDPLTNVTSIVNAVNGLTATYWCGSGVQCDPANHKVGDLTSIDLDFQLGGNGSDPNEDFTTLNLPSLGFLPSGAGDLSVQLSWSLNVRLTATENDLQVTSAPGAHMLTLGVTITGPSAGFEVNLGALVVQATTQIAPKFTGQLYADLDAEGDLEFGFGPNTKFEAKWHLAAKESSPLRGVIGDLHVLWELGSVTDDGVDATKLKIALENVEIETSKFVGEDLKEVAAAIRDVVHPIRQATSPMLEPIPGLSELSSLVDGKDVTMLRLMGLTRGLDPGTGLDQFPYQKMETALKRIQLLDDVAVQLGGGGNVKLGSFTLASSDALTPNGTPLPAGAVATLKKIVDECAPCKEKLGDLLEAVNGDRNPGSGSGFKFDVPVLSDPASLAGVLLGRNVDLITFDTGFLGYNGTLDTTVARFFIFSVKLHGPIVAGIHLKGGVDTAGIAAALKGDGAEELLHGVYLQNPENGGVVRLSSNAGIGVAAGVELVEVQIKGAPAPNINLRIPDSTPGGKLRPALLKESATTVGCELLKSGSSDFSVRISAIFDYWIEEHEEVLTDHTFLTAKDLCDKDANKIPVAYDDLNGNVIVDPVAFNDLPVDEPALIKVYMVHTLEGAPKTVVVEGNNGRRVELPAAGKTAVRFDANQWTRPVVFRVVKNDEKPFELKVFVETGSGADDVLVDSAQFGLITVNGGDDTVVVAAGGDPDDPAKGVSGGQGNDLLIGGDKADFLQGDEGDDRLLGGGGRDRLGGGPGQDVLEDSSPEGNCLVGGTERDLLISGPGPDRLFGDETIFCDASFNPENDGVVGDGNDVIISGGGADYIVAGGGDDDVRLHGTGAFDRDNPAWRADSTVHGNGGADEITTGNGADAIHGGPGDDDIAADTAPPLAILHNGGADNIHGGTGADDIDAGDGGDTVFGDNGRDTCAATMTGQPPETDTVGTGDTVHGGAGDDVIALEAGDDHAAGGDDFDAICGHAGADTIYGDDLPGAPQIGAAPGEDTLFGGTGGDALHAGDRADLAFGNAGADTINGNEGADRLVGGSSAAAVADTGDTISGGDDDDVIVGDNGTISGATPRVVTLFDLFAADASLGGGDAISGNDGADRAFGGLGNDTIGGGDADDHLEGNNGDDGISGNAGDDDIMGGTSDESLPNAAAGQTAADAPDGGETLLSGGAGLDVIIGDNGNITRPGGTDPILGGPARAVVLFDRDRTGLALSAVSGPDYVEGNGDSDRIYGQGGDDYLKGNGADDFIEGNQGGDRLEGNDGEDDLIGGSSFTVSAGVGDPDGGDQLAGGAGADVLIGDNAAITRATTGNGAGFDWDSVANNWLGQAARRSITLLDKSALVAGNFGDDVLSGGAGADVMFGQDGVDRLYGGAHDDSMEGNGGGDLLFGDQIAAPTGNAHESAAEQLDGPSGPDGQDDQLGGSSWVKARAGSGAVTGQRDGADEIHGDGNADVQLGDNGRILRVIVNGQYATYEAHTGKPTIVRQANPTGTAPSALPARFDVGASAAAGVWGADTLYGDAGDDVQLAGDGNDTLYGGADDDDMYGELGDDRMFGEAGEDAMVGDRGVVTNRLVSTPGATISVNSPPAVSFTPYAAHPLDRRVDLNDDGDGAPLQSPGMTTGGADFMRGGPDHDAMHGAAGNDLMNGDSGGDYLFGGDGVDVIWGGKGHECANSADLACNSDRGVNDAYVDYLFGGNGLRTDPVTGGADILDYRPRPGLDPASWFEATSTRGTDAMEDHQHHQGIDWIYGGWDRDVMQADIADNGPNAGDRLLDWTGAYNLYTHCPSAYGGYNDVRTHSPSLQSFLQQLALALGAGNSLADIQTKGTSGYNELALVYSSDVKSNSGSAYPGTPGHFDDFSCAP